MWASWSDFFAMGGYALYVWGAYAVCLALMLLEPWLARRRRHAALHSSEENA
jgi:heme exporter protein D